MSAYSISPSLDELIQAIYKGPMETPLWQSFLATFRQVLDAEYVTLLLRPPKQGDLGVVLNAVIHSPDLYEAYNETYFALDTFVDLPPGVVCTVQEYMPREELLKTEFYQRFMKPSGVYHILGADMCAVDGFKARLRATRGKGRADFGDSEKQITTMILPHLEQAIQLHLCIARMTTERNLYENAIDHLQMGAVILDENVRVLRTNKVAENLFRASYGLRMTDGRLVVGNREDNIRFRALIDEVLQAHKRSEPGFIRAFKIRRSDAESGLGLLIRPIPIVEASEGEQNPSVAIFFSDPEQPRSATIDVLKQLFEFTPSEAALSLLLANGLTLDEASGELGITRNTAKSHLSAIFSKTGVTRQPKLVQLILKSVATLG